MAKKQEESDVDPSVAAKRTDKAVDESPLVLKAEQEARDKLREGKRKTVELGSDFHMQEMIVSDAEANLVHLQAKTRAAVIKARKRADADVSAAQDNLGAVKQHSNEAVAVAQRNAEVARQQAKDSLERESEMRLEQVKISKLGVYDEAEKEDQERDSETEKAKAANERIEANVATVSSLVDRNVAKFKRTLGEAVEEGKDLVKSAKEAGEAAVRDAQNKISNLRKTLTAAEDAYTEATRETRALKSSVTLKVDKARRHARLMLALKAHRL